MKTKLILLTAVLAVFAAQGAAAPRWAGDKPDSWMNKHLKAGHAISGIAMEIGTRGQGTLTPEAAAELKRDQDEFDSFYEWHKKRQASNK